jgi:hypothetical protein
MNSWANIGDLVFIVGNNEEIIPAKVIKELIKKPFKDSVLYFQPIEDEKVIPKAKRKCTLAQVGYKGGFVFREKDNALDYLDIVKKEGRFNMSSAINRKARRNQQKMGITDFNQIKAQAAQEAVDKTQSVLISALLLALNSELGIGPKRGEKVIAEMNRLIETTSPETLKAEAERKMLK